jgi:hypothetical protein
MRTRDHRAAKRRFVFTYAAMLGYKCSGSVACFIIKYCILVDLDAQSASEKFLLHGILHLPELRDDAHRVRLASGFPIPTSASLERHTRRTRLAWGVSSRIKTFQVFSSPIVDFPVVQESLRALAISLKFISFAANE